MTWNDLIIWKNKSNLIQILKIQINQSVFIEQHTKLEFSILWNHKIVVHYFLYINTPVSVNKKYENILLGISDNMHLIHAWN